MKKLKKIHISLIACMLILAVAGLFSPEVKAAVTSDLPDLLVTYPETSSKNTSVYDQTITEREFWQKEEISGQFFSTNSTVLTTQSTGTFKSQLTGKALEIYKALEKTKLSVSNPGVTIKKTFSTKTNLNGVINQYMSVYERALFAYEYDHLDQLYWQGDNEIGFQYSYTIRKSKIALSMRFYYKVSPYYHADLEKIANAKITEVVKKAKTLNTTYKKLEYLNRWICDNCTYDYASLSASAGTKETYFAHTAMGCLILKRGVCETYAKTLKLLCQKLNIPCLVVNSSTHAFNYVKMENGLWYMIDTTWNDSGDQASNYKTYFLTSNYPYMDQDHVTNGLLSFPYTAAKAYTNGTEDDTGSGSDTGETEDSDGSSSTSPSVYPYYLRLSTATYSYNGASKTPAVTVYDNYNRKISSAYYTVRYMSSRKNVGLYPVLVTFRGKYSDAGSYALYYMITPSKTKIRSLSGKSKGFTVKWSKKTSQVTGYEIQYSTNSKFKSGVKRVVVSSYKTASKTIRKLKSKKRYYIRVRTYKNIPGDYSIVSKWSPVKSVKTK